MKIPTLILIMTGTIFLAGCRNNTSRLSIYDLRCENLTDPFGIALTVPGMSWKINTGRNGTSQKAFQLLAASSPELLNEEKADLWNSGKVESSASVLVPYGGKDLISGAECYWKVRIWDEKGLVSGWSETAFYSVGLLDESDWEAVYIGMPGLENDVVSPLLWNTFTVNDTTDRIFLHVNSLGYHEVYINGNKAGNKVLTPAVSQFNKRSLVVTYDITELVRKGKNDVVFWLGSGWYSKGLPGVSYDRPLVRAQAEQITGGKHVTLILTGPEWKCRRSGYSRIGTWRSGDYGGELIDAALLLPDLSGSSLEGSSWEKVFTSGNNGIPATPQTTESNRITDTIKAVSVIPFGNDKWLVDMGTTLSGWAAINFHSLKPGQELVMEYSDHLEKDGNLKDQGQEDRYIASGKEGEEFINKFNYHGFRFITIANLKEPPRKEDITGYLIHTDYRLSSSFECSDTDLNRIHDMIFYTLTCLSTGGDLVDCPQIERLGYGGDGNASTLTAQTMFDLEPLYSNWLQAWGDCIREDGGMPHTAPNPYPAGGGPYWCGFIITASWKTYVNYGDERILTKYYPVMQKWLEYVKKYSPEGLLERWPDTDYRAWYLGDWAVPEGTDQTDKSSIDLVNNCFIAVCYETMQKIADVLGRETDAEGYAARKEEIRRLINLRLYNPAAKIYGCGSQIDLTFPLLAGVVNDSLTPAIRENLLRITEVDHNGHIACGLVGIPVLTEWAVKNREADLIFSMLKKRDYAGYLYMTDNGATTTWEHWNGARSRIHNCYNGIGSWFYQAVGGIIPDEKSPGYRHFFIAPEVPDSVTWANTSKETPYGTIVTRWKISGNEFTMEITVPPGTTASLMMPENCRNLTIDGRSQAMNVTYHETGSGKHVVRCSYQNTGPVQ
jgi:alpha-L-rhamnosidase